MLGEVNKQKDEILSMTKNKKDNEESVSRGWGKEVQSNGGGSTVLKF